MSFFTETTWRGVKSLFNHGLYYRLTEEDHNALRKQLASGYFIILTGGHPSLSSFLIKLASYFKTRKWPKYTHVLMNVDNLEDPLASEHFKLIEAIGVYGVKYSSFMRVFDCDYVTLLRPRGYTNEDWEGVLDRAKNNLGKPYDSLFDLLNDSEMSCVELVRDALSTGDRNYSTKFKNFEDMIRATGGDLTPQMFLDCADFEVAFSTEKLEV